MNERLKELAEQAGITFDRTNDLVGEDSDLERFAELIRQDERENIKRDQQACYVERGEK